MFAVVLATGLFSGVTYPEMNDAIMQHHTKFGETFALVSTAPVLTVLDDEQETYGEPTPDQLTDYETWLAKQKKATEIATIKVTVDSLEFDGDENSQALMERNAVTMAAEGLESIPWKMADNTFADVTAEQLNQAVMLAAAAQRDIVVKYG